ncbi:MAG: Spy/CpxP family protein refolding chaperone [Rhizobiales bacterium]|nr:Spy/CpxP family protein refolding chaperone [Hyphomicrobiales bacterium]
MKKIFLAGVAAATLLTTGAVYAQHRGPQERMHQRMSVEDRAAFIDARIAAVKAGLKLTPDQEKNWPAVETAVRDFAKQRMDFAATRAKEWQARRAEREQNKDAKPAERAPVDQIARLRERADTMAAEAASLKKIADAAEPLYKSLDEGQKRRLAMLTRMERLGGFWSGPGFRRGGEHGSRHHFDREDRGPRRDRSERL